MTDFQLGLLAIGALAVAGVFAYNRIQERSARRAAERAFRAPAGDALLEPAVARREAPPQEPRASPGRSAVLAQVALPDERIDYVVELSFAEPLPVASLVEQWKPHERRYARRALLAYSADGAEWQRLAPDASNEAFHLNAGLQLATPDGAVGEAELIEFRAAVESLAAATGASIAAPEMRQAVERARELDQFCADNDIQVVINVMPDAGGGFAGDRLRQVAEASGLSLAADGRLVLADEAGRVRFTLAARDGTAFTAGGVEGAASRGLSLTLDVPRAPATRQSFRSMSGFARELAGALGGSLVDDNDRALDERAVAAIDAQLGAVEAAFAARGIEPGSATAQRLFS